jgi:hypothetical protein
LCRETKFHWVQEFQSGKEVEESIGLIKVSGTFTISRAESSQEWISQPNIMRFYGVIYLQSDTQPDVLRLTCQDWDGPLMGTDITVPEIRDALGGYFSFEFAQQG